MSSETHVRTTAVLRPPYHPRGTAAEVIGAASRRATTEAAVAAGAHDFIAELPEGYHTPLGPGGVPLTDAQALRLTVAGLLVLDPPTLVLDDPTAGLDPLGESAALPGLETLLHGRQVRVRRASPAVHAVVNRALLRERRVIPLDPAPPAPAGRLPEPPHDPALPTLGRLLDPAAMAPLLTRGPPGAIGDVRVVSVRYKPGDNLTVQYAVQLPGRWATAVAFASSTSALATKPSRRRPSRAAASARKKAPVPEPLVFVPEVDALVQWLPLDLGLPVMADGRSKLNRRLAEAGLASVEGARPRVLRYSARRRAVIRLGPYVLKTYRDRDDFEQARQGLVAGAGLRSVRTPALLGTLPRRRTTVQQRVKGGCPSWGLDDSGPAGDLLAALHAETAAGLRTTSPAHILAKSRARAGVIARLDPDLGPRLDEILAGLAQTAPESAALVTSHGNFHAGQLLARNDGLTLIDLDRMCLAPRAFDLACFTAQYALGHPDDAALLGRVGTALLAGYGEVPSELPWYLAACLLRRALAPFRHQNEHWRQATEQLVTLSLEALR